MIDIYFDNVLKGFLDKKSKVRLRTCTRELPYFIVTDIDLDDMPEIIFTFIKEEEIFVGVLKKEADEWKIKSISTIEEAGEDIASLVQHTTSDNINQITIGEAFTIEKLLGEGQNSFIGLVDEAIYYCKVEQLLQEDEDYLRDKSVLDFTEGDVTVTGVKDKVYLVGDKKFGDTSQYAENIQLIIQTVPQNEIIAVSLPTSKGYNPSLFLADFTGDKAKDIMITMLKDPAGGPISAYIYTVEDRIPKLIFDYEAFNQSYTGNVIYKDDYRVEIETEIPQKKYVLDLTEQDNEEIQELYDETGRLIVGTEAIKGNLSELIALNPLDYDKNGIYELATEQGIQSALGQSILGLIETFLRWNPSEKKFEPIAQYMAVSGMNRT